jgi:hypothetical protein
MSIVLDGSGTISGLNADGLASQPVFPGNVLQVVSATKLDAFTTTSLTPVDITGLSVSITPSSATSKILILSHVFVSSNATSGGYLNLVRNSTALSVGTAGSINSTFSSWEQSSSFWGSIPAIFLDSPNTTSATTYKVQAFVTGGTIYINRRGTDATIGGSASITVMEIAG